MMRVDRKFFPHMAAVVITALTGCSQIDDDLSDCLPGSQVDYELTLVTNMTTELQTQLNTVTDVQVSDALKSDLQHVFREFAQDVDLSFYDTAGDSVRLHHENHIMNDNQSSYSINLPGREYMHLATANILNNAGVTQRNDERCHSSRINQVAGDTIDSQEVGVFTARQYMDVKTGVDQTYTVKLYMANCAIALVVDTTGVSYKDFRVFAKGFATDFQIADSSFVFPEQEPVVRAKEVKVAQGSPKVAFRSVNFPSHNPSGWWMKPVATRVEGEVIKDGDDSSGVSLWEFIAFVTLDDGSVTKTVLSVADPVLAGSLKVIVGKLNSKGEVVPKDMTVGVTITPNWGEGPDFEQVL